LDASFYSFIDTTSALLVVDGELDLSSRYTLTDRLLGLELQPVEIVQVDLLGVTFIDVGCLRELALSRDRLAASGRRLDVVAAHHAVRTVAGLAHFEGLLSPPPLGSPGRHSAGGPRWQQVPRRLPAALAQWLAKGR
jgi:anti-anti-sigma regulatory factor